jgi:hypothetical protein
MIQYKKTNDLDFCHAGQDALYGEGTQFLPEIKKKVVMVIGGLCLLLTLIQNTKKLYRLCI